MKLILKFHMVFL